MPDRTLPARPKLSQLSLSRPDPALARYLEALAACTGAIMALHQRWQLEQATHDDSERLANTAAILRWEFNQLARAHAGREAPPQARQLHAEVEQSLLTAQRACQMLSNGYRFHNLDKICDGGELLDQAQQIVASAHEIACRPLAGV